MKLSNKLTQDGIFEEIDRICGSTSSTYSSEAKTARVNSALDRYLQIAFKADNRWNFDDINETSPPIDTQNLVSGTNRYKLSDFTEKIHNLIRLEVLTSAGKGRYLIPEMISDLRDPENYHYESGRVGYINNNTFQDLYLDPQSGTPTHYIKYGDFIYLRPSPNYNETDGLKAYFNRPASKFNFTRVTFTDANPAVFTSTGHGLSENDTVYFRTTGALSGNLEENTTYYVISTGLTSDAFQVSTTQGGTAVDTSGGGQSGEHAFLSTIDEPGIPELHHHYIARYSSLPYLIEKKLPQVNSVASQVAMDEREIEAHFGQRDEDIPNRMKPIIEDTK